MREIRELNRSDVPQMLEVYRSRPLMMNSKTATMPDYEYWLTHGDGWDGDKVSHFGLFEDSELLNIVTLRYWYELPVELFEKTYTINIYSKKTSKPIERGNLGHNMNIIELINYAIAKAEEASYYKVVFIVNTSPNDDKRIPYFLDPLLKYSKYEVTEIQTLEPGQIPSSHLFQKYLVARAYDIPLYIRQFYLPEAMRNAN